MIPIPLPSPKHKYCHLCGSPLLLTYIRYSTGLVVCPQCERNAPRCTACQQPARTLVSVEHERLCQHCLSTLPRCAACGKPVSGHYFRFGDSPKPYCPTCSAKRPTCPICGAPLGADGIQLRGGQYRCGECAQTMVQDDQTAQALYQVIIQQSRAILDRDVQHIPLLRIVDPAELALVRRRHEHLTPPIGAIKPHILGFFEQHGHKRTIYIERALPRATLIGTLAHEYAHAWQADHAPQQQSTLQREGFAEWLSHRILVALGHIREAARATRREDDYGRGLRHFLALEQQHGRQEVFEAARSAKTIITRKM